MNTLAALNTFIIKEHIGWLKINNTYDLIDPESGEIFAVAKEETSTWIKLLSLLHPSFFPTTINVYENGVQSPFLTLKKGFSWFRSRLDIYNGKGDNLGYIESKILTLVGGFRIFTPAGQQVATITGNWTGFNFKIELENGQQAGLVAKQWGGIGKELLTTADTYVVSVNEEAGDYKTLLLASCLAIDTVFKEDSE